MAEMVLRRRRRRKGMLDEPRIRLPIPTRVQVRSLITALAEAAPAFLLALAELLDMPPGSHAAYMASLAVLGRGIRLPLAGAASAMLLRLLSGVDPRWEGGVTLLILFAAPLVLPGRGNAALMGFTAASLLPMAIRGCLSATAGEMLLSLASVAVSVLCAPIICRGMKALTASGRDGNPAHIETMEDRLSVGVLGLLVMCGGARLLIAGINAGMLMASCVVLTAAVCFGPSIGCAAGMISGLMLTLCGLPMAVALSLSAGGFLAGVLRAAAGRKMCCVTFMLAAISPLMLTGAGGAGCSVGILAATMAVMLLPGEAFDRLRLFCMRFRSNQPEAGNAYAASMLAAWEKTVDAMAMAVPAPTEENGLHDGSWWRASVCEGCPELPGCTCMETTQAAEKAAAVWTYHEAEDPVWEGALENLRGLGCQRLYHLRQGMSFMRREAAAKKQAVRRAREQRSMLVTHLCAMAGAARRFAMLSSGENWWDTVTARRIRRAISEAASPVRLMWIRRVQGHVHAAFELQSITGARRQAEEMCALVEAVCGAPMSVARIDGDRVWLAETPLLSAVCGVCSCGVQGESRSICGDTAWFGRLQDGRCMAALSDGMGHGEQAALTSRQTVELLRLCLDAGYTRQQTLTAVNGMLLLGSQGERFTTVDLLTIDLWSGVAALDKQGAAGSWLWQQDALHQVTGDALPLGILETIESGENMLRLQPGDAVVLMTDGVEDAFADRESLQDAILLALTEASPQEAAESLLAAAQRSEGGVRRDDQTVVVIRIESARCTKA